MTQVRNLFDPQKGLQRSIEKVISYQASQEDRLKAEISEYIVTDSIDEQLEKLLENIQAALESGGGHEVGVWVSGFYGSGKSSFTKYLGLALDDSVQVDGQPFVRHLNDRLRRPQTKALLDAVNKRFSAAVIMLDLASQQIAGATLAEVSSVLYYKVLQELGYSRNMKVAALERKLKKDSRYEEFKELFQEETGEVWEDYQNDELVVDSLLPNLAHKMYPALFKSDQAFSAATSETIYLMDDRVREMIDVVRDETGKENIVFVIDEIGQYVGSQQAKILDLQGLAENIKNIGQGKVWILGTAQQTLTEDDPHIAINSPELFKLKDRFPISVELVSDDIKEICFRRLLGKSSDGLKWIVKKKIIDNSQLLKEWTHSNHFDSHNVILYDRPTNEWFNNEFHKAGLVMLGNLDNDVEGMELKKKGVKTSAWTFWPRRPYVVETMLEKEGILEWDKRDIESIFVGNFENKIQEKYRKTDDDWESVLDVYHCTQGTQHNFTQEEYLEQLANAKYGLCLRGYGSKCHREVELMALGTVPIITESVCVDSYMDPPQENIHYIRCNNPDNLKTLLSYITVEEWLKMSNNCYNWYQKNVHSKNSFNNFLTNILYN